MDVSGARDKHIIVSMLYGLHEHESRLQERFKRPPYPGLDDVSAAVNLPQ